MTTITPEEAKELGHSIGINWGLVRFQPADLARGMAVEYEHGSRDPRTNVTDDDPKVTAKIAWAHLNEFPDYYARLEHMEQEAKAFWTAHDLLDASDQGLPQ